MIDAMEKTEKTARVFVMGKKYEVPEGLTIMKALEYSGYRHVRGVGCRAGFCGACSTIYRMEGDHKLRGALACQSTVVDGMHIVQIPFVPANKAIYSIEGLSKDELGAIVLANYPEIARCLSCNTCTKACPQKIEVMDYIQACLRGDIAPAAAQNMSLTTPARPAWNSCPPGDRPSTVPRARRRRRS
jgi:succinate dehydrogenase/fumarate reductase-like Fe-S protein